MPHQNARADIAPMPMRLGNSIARPLMIAKSPEDRKDMADQAATGVYIASLERPLKKQSAISPFQKLLVELLLFLSIEPWWRVHLFCFRRGRRSDLG